eukprot:5709046-Prymnesium_polylepis.1
MNSTVRLAGFRNRNFFVKPSPPSAHQSLRPSKTKAVAAFSGIGPFQKEQGSPMRRIRDPCPPRPSPVRES